MTVQDKIIQELKRENKSLKKQLELASEILEREYLLQGNRVRTKEQWLNYLKKSEMELGREYTLKG